MLVRLLHDIAVSSLS